MRVLFIEGFLGASIAAGLRMLGWRLEGPGREALGARAVIPLDDQAGRSPSALRPRPGAQLVLVGGPDRLAALADGVLRGASAAINAALPYADVLRLVDAALRAAPASPAWREHLLARLRQRRAESDRFSALTDREALVLADLAQGLSAADIARSRTVSLATVRTQIASILRKLEAASQTAAVALTYRACCDRRVLQVVRFHQNY